MEKIPQGRKIGSGSLSYKKVPKRLLAHKCFGIKSVIKKNFNTQWLLAVPCLFVSQCFGFFYAIVKVFQASENLLKAKSFEGKARNF